MNNKYDDIINLPHHISKKHPQMTLEARAAQFAPFAALTGYEDAINETARQTSEKIELDDEAKEILDNKIQIIKEQIDDMKNGKFSDEDIQHAKELIIASFKAMQDEQDSEISFYFGREIQKESKDIDKQIKEVSEVTKQNIVDVANKIKINTIFFLTRE